MKSGIRIRTRFLLAVEGRSEQSFIAWLQQLADNTRLHIHLDCKTLSGGGYKKMLTDTIKEHERKSRSRAKSSILLVDSDRGDRDEDGWTLDQLRQVAKKHKIVVCVQEPNHEAWLLRLFPGKEKQLRKVWPDYQKPMDARTLASKFSLTDLCRAALEDLELAKLLSIIGFVKS